jgi:hypothetical protein
MQNTSFARDVKNARVPLRAVPPLDADSPPADEGIGAWLAEHAPADPPKPRGARERARERAERRRLLRLFRSMGIARPRTTATRRAAAPKPRPRAAHRAPKRSAAKSAAPSGADGPPPDPEPPRQSRVSQIAALAAVDAPILVNQRTALAVGKRCAR